MFRKSLFALVFAVLGLTVFSATSALCNPSVALVGNNGLKTFVGESIAPLDPIIVQKRISVEYILPDAQVAVLDRADSQNRVLTLFLNAVNSLPESARMIVSYDNVNNRVIITLPDKEVAYSVNREVTDTQGNIFTITTRQGQGMEYSMKL